MQQIVDEDSEDSNAMLTSMWVECPKTLAHVEQWEEKVILLQEEMQRIITFSNEEGISGVLLSRIIAYTNKQSTMYHNLALHFVELWYPIVTNQKILEVWKVQYPQMKVKNYKQFVVEENNSDIE